MCSPRSPLFLSVQKQPPLMSPGIIWLEATILVSQMLGQRRILKFCKQNDLPSHLCAHCSRALIMDWISICCCCVWLLSKREKRFLPIRGLDQIILANEKPVHGLDFYLLLCLITVTERWERETWINHQDDERQQPLLELGKNFSCHSLLDGGNKKYIWDKSNFPEVRSTKTCLTDTEFVQVLCSASEWWNRD